MSDEKTHYSSQAGAWCGAGWDVPRSSDVDEVTCADCLRQHAAHLLSLHREAKERLRVVNIEASRCDACRKWPCVCPTADDESEGAA